MLRRCLGHLFAQILDFGLELGILLAEFVNGGLELSILSTKCYHFPIDGCEVLNEAFVLHAQDIDRVLHRLEGIVAALALAGQPSYGCSDGWH